MQDQITRKFSEALLQRSGAGSVSDLTRKFSKAFGGNDMRRTKSTGTMLRPNTSIADIQEDPEANNELGSVSTVPTVIVQIFLTEVLHFDS